MKEIIMPTNSSSDYTILPTTIANEVESKEERSEEVEVIILKGQNEPLAEFQH